MPEHVLFLFVDGIGLGPPGPDNPLSNGELQGFARLSGGQPWTSEADNMSSDRRLFRPIDARLGVEGLPQSGTGQATLFTGINCAEVVGRHFGPFPHSSTKDIIADENLFTRLKRRNSVGGTSADGTSPGDGMPDAGDSSAAGGASSTGDEPAAFANAYPPVFFEANRRRGRWTVTTLACRAAGLKIRGINELTAGEAVPADLTGDGWRRKLDLSVPLRTESEAARHLHALHLRHRLTLFEYYLTDKAGHGRLDDPDAVLASLDRFLAGLLEVFDPEESLLLLTSDHGNLEDISLKTHTKNPVPLVAYGRGAHHFQDVSGLAGVTPALMKALE